MIIVKLITGLVTMILPHHYQVEAFSQLPPVWQCIAHYESTDNLQAINPTTKDQGAFQFNLNTWSEFAPATYPSQPINASLDQQYTVALNLWTQRGFEPWQTAPLCGV